MYEGGKKNGLWDGDGKLVVKNRFEMEGKWR
jgi:hypothetical protein